MAGDIQIQDIALDNEGSSLCCLEHAALECLPVPVVIHDLDHLLFVNAAARAIEPALRAGEPISAFSAPETAAASQERREFMLSADASLGDVMVKVPRSSGGCHTIIVRGRPVGYGGEKALVQLIRVVDGDVKLSYEPQGDGRGVMYCPTNSCMHEAAYEALPAPSTIIDRDTIHRANCEFRRMVGASGTLRNVPVETVVHPDFAAAAAQRRHLVVDYGAPVTGASVKFRAFDSADVYSMIDACRVQYGGASYMATLTHHSTRV